MIFFWNDVKALFTHAILVRHFHVHRYVMAAQALVGDARGTLSEKGWRRANGELASYDDISAFVIPISQCSSEMAKYTVKFDTLPSCKATHSIDNEED